MYMYILNRIEYVWNLQPGEGLYPIIKYINIPAVKHGNIHKKRINQRLKSASFLLMTIFATKWVQVRLCCEVSYEQIYGFQSFLDFGIAGIKGFCTVCFL